MIDGFADAVSLSVIGVWAYPLVLAVARKQVDLAYISLGAWVVSLATSAFKKGTETWFPDIGLFHRPATAMNCNLVNRGGFVGLRPGFPSGHTATAAFLATVLFYDSAPWVKMAAAVWVVLVGASRLMKECHTVVQVAVGALFGIVCAVAYTAIVLRKWLPPTA
jgi:membrane-associated phospholipid phosphatase